MIPLLLTGVILLTGCKNTENQNTLSQPPKDDVAAIGAFLPSGSELLVPEKAAKKQSIYINAQAGREAQKAFLLYRNITDNRQAHLVYLTKENGTWQKKEDMETGFLGFDTFELTDLDGDGVKEAIVGGSISNTGHDNQLAIYKLEKDTLTKTSELNYDALSIADYTKDQIPDIMAITKKQDNTSAVGLYFYEKGNLKLLSQIDLDPQGFFEHAVFGTLANGEKALFADSGMGAHSMLTEIIVYQNGNLEKVGDPSDSVLLKAYPLYSRDINGDGIIEVGGMYIPKGYEDAAFAEIPFINTYQDYKLDGTFQVVEERYTDQGQHFYISIPKELYEGVTVKCKDNEILLLSTQGDTVLFQVKWAANDSLPSNAVVLGKTKETSFYTELKEETKIPTSAFHLMEEELN
jgi:hypothetical protein